MFIIYRLASFMYSRW